MVVSMLDFPFKSAFGVPPSQETLIYTYRGFHKWGYPKWMVSHRNFLLKLSMMTGGTPIFRKFPNGIFIEFSCYKPSNGDPSPVPMGFPRVFPGCPGRFEGRLGLVAAQHLQGCGDAFQLLAGRGINAPSDYT